MSRDALNAATWKRRTDRLLQQPRAKPAGLVDIHRSLLSIALCHYKRLDTSTSSIRSGDEIPLLSGNSPLFQDRRASARDRDRRTPSVLRVAAWSSRRAVPERRGGRRDGCRACRQGRDGGGGRIGRRRWTALFRGGGQSGEPGGVYGRTGSGADRRRPSGGGSWYGRRTRVRRG